MLKLVNVWYSYDSSKWALRGASMELKPGSIVGVIGPNGAGKTTMLKVAGLLLKPLRGHVVVDGGDPWASRETLEKKRRLVVYVHEKPIMLRGSVLDNIAYGLTVRGVDPAEAKAKAERVAEKLELKAILHARAKRLSTGQAQLVAIARAVAVEPRYLLLDEPFAHLDSARRRLLASLVRELASTGTGIAIASHDTLLLAKLAETLVYVENGVTKQLASLEEV